MCLSLSFSVYTKINRCEERKKIRAGRPRTADKKKKKKVLFQYSNVKVYVCVFDPSAYEEKVITDGVVFDSLDWNE
jgi:hypothetical protein